MGSWYSVTAEDLQRMEGSFDLLKSLNIGETIHFDSAKPDMPNFNKLIDFMDYHYEYDVSDGNLESSGWFVLIIKKIKR